MPEIDASNTPCEIDESLVTNSVKKADICSDEIKS